MREFTDKVKQHLENNPHLVQVINDIEVEVVKYFPGDECSVDFWEDPIKLEPDKFIFYIHTKVEPEECVKKLQQFDKEWWIKYSEKLEFEEICVMAEYW
jgi:hypothetical protein